MIYTQAELKELLEQPDANPIEILYKASKYIVLDSEILMLIKEKNKGSTLTLISILSQYSIDEIVLKKEIFQSLGSYSEEVRALIEELVDKIGVIPFWLEKDNILFSEHVINKLGIDNVFLIFKNGYLPESGKKNYGITEINFDVLLDPENLDSYIYIYGEILGYDVGKIDILSFLDIARKYLRSPQIFNDILRDASLRDELKQKLHEYFLCNYPNLKISSIDDVRNIEVLIEKCVRDKIGFARLISATCGNDMTEDFGKKDLIELIGSRNLQEMLMKISDEKIEELADVLTSDDTNGDFENLANLKLFMDIAKKIRLNPDESEEFATAFMQELSAEDRITIWETYAKAESDLVRAYERELNESMVSIGSSVREKQKGVSSNSDLENVSIDGGEESVPYLTLREPGILVQHVMNAYQKNHSNGKIDLFLNGPGLVTAPILSTTTITNESKECLANSKRIGTCGKHEIKDENDVVVLFDEMPTDSLVSFGACDCSIQAATNDLESVSSWTGVSPTSFGLAIDTIYKAVAKGEQGTEYVFYLDDRIKPAGIRVMGDRPIKPELVAAKKLGVPLVKLEKATKKQCKERTHKKLVPTEKVSIAMQKVNDILERLISKNGKKSIDSEQIGRATFGYLGPQSAIFENELYGYIGEEEIIL